MLERPCILVGVPIGDGAGTRGCELGPRTLRAAGIASRLCAGGRVVVDRGDLLPVPTRSAPVPARARVKALSEVAAWTECIAAAAYRESAGGIPVFLGGDHSLSMGTLTGLSRRAAEAGRALFVVWLDAHPDFHTLETTISGNLHGTPVAYATGRRGFEGAFAALAHPVAPRDVAMLGIRSVDPAEGTALRRAGVDVVGMQTLNALGASAVLGGFLDRVSAANGWLHVSFDADFLDPGIAPGVGTPVPGGASTDRALEVMTALRRSGLVGSVDLAELNPLLDPRGVTGRLMVDLTACLLAVDEAARTMEMEPCPPSSMSCLSSASTG